ncbi:MAG: hypothetical protein OEW69_09265 [Nitrospirota bacterium]|nr:hypothetical protein [Nitrospirota bacterium]
MKAEIGTLCYFCKCSMNRSTKPRMIFDLEKEELLGLAHSGCTNKKGLEWYTTKAIKWGEETPSTEIVSFGCRIARALKIQSKGPDSVEFYVRMLLYKCLWKTGTVDECLNLKDVRIFLDHWVNGPLNMDPEKADRIKRILRTELGKGG